MKKQICILLAALLVLSLAGCGVRDEPPEERIIPEIEETDTSSVETFAVAEQPEKEPENEPKRISGWSEGSPAMAEIIASVESITDEASPTTCPLKNASHFSISTALS